MPLLDSNSREMAGNKVERDGEQHTTKAGFETGHVVVHCCCLNT